ncbi:transposase [Pelagicoccus enzymogenes]|uniref:REP-associated tyrosine transposase n=1 Tax=Pelagicoccus enzymogenes TaxID=2773457 RepID=UPI00280C513C|nr:transposase [Pelagicoccus enzymogenes]MDQ8200381.1 transposase [Pelagicoccus enzymogenes]
MPQLPIRKTHHLAYGRVSIPGATYFITLVTQNRKTDLTANDHPEHIADTLRALHRDKIINLRCATTMPDHLHLLFVLGEVCDLSLAISKFKNATRKALAAHSLYWHRNYYDHRIRQEANTNDFARYIFLNPYRKSLLTADQLWPHWLCNRTYKPDFQEQLNPDGTPPAAWYKNAPTAQDLTDQDTHP